jgi:hypothetical protein
MKILKYITLKINNENKENALYLIINKTQAFDLLYLLSYLFFEYSTRDYDFILESIETSYNQLDDEVVVQGTRKNIFLDLNNPNNFYIASLFDYLNCNINNSNFVEKLKHNQFKYSKINKNSFLQLLKSWNNVLDTKPSHIILYQDNNNQIILKSFDSQDSMDLFVEDHIKI